MQRNNPLNILDLPECMLENILEYLSYDEIARKRTVCCRFDKAAQHVLNRGFNKMIKTHSAHMKRLKALLPRRESERRSHPLARHTDILTCIETRISMLSMTYSKYIDLNLCCFIPGKIIDEVYNIFKLIQSDTKQLRAHEVLQELRDISSMAIEHFDEKIANGLKKSYMTSNATRLSVAGSIASSSELLHLTPPSLTVDDISEVRRCDGENQCRQARMNKQALVRMEARYKNAIKKFNQMIEIQNKQMRHLRHNSLRISQLTTKVAELKRQIEESDAKNCEIKANISQIAQEAGTSIAATASPTPVRNIKPRSATIILKRRITESYFDSADYPQLKQIKLDDPAEDSC